LSDALVARRLRHGGRRDAEADAELTETEAPARRSAFYENADFQGKVACWGGHPDGEQGSTVPICSTPGGRTPGHSIKDEEGR
jgi:hypothetical protein